MQEVSGSTPLSSTIEGPAGNRGAFVPSGIRTFHIPKVKLASAPKGGWRMRNLIQLDGLKRGEDAAFLLLRLYLGGFLIWGVWDNIVSTARMAEFQAFLTGLNCPLPALAAPVSVWAQLLIGVLLLSGLLTRWAGVLLAINFIVAVLLLGGAGATARDLFGPMMCVLAGLVLAAHGAGQWSADARMPQRR